MPASETASPTSPTDPVLAAMVSQLPEHLKDLWQERAAIREFDGSQSRELAEAMALLDVIRMHTHDVLACWLP